MYVPPKALGSFLIDARLLTRAQLESFESTAARSGEALYTLLHTNAAVQEDELRRAAAFVLGVPFVQVGHGDIQPEALMLVPEPLARTNSLAAVSRAGNAVKVLLLDLDALESVKFLEDQQLTLIPHLTDRASLKRALLAQQKELRTRYGDRLKNPEDAAALDALLSHASASRASEVHLEPRKTADLGHELRVRYRSGGALYDAMMLGAQTANISSRIKELANLSFTMSVPQEGRFKVALRNGEQLRVRTHILPVHGGEKIMLHLARESTGQKGFTLDTLGMHGETLDLVHDMLARRTGLILVATPPGGGKTTLLYTLLDMIASPYISAVSVEEEMEVSLAHVMQVPVRRDIGLTYPAALRAALKQKPDVLMIADIADEDTAGLAAGAASRGTLVLAGIEANSAAEALEKMLSLNVPPALLAAVFLGAIGQRLVRQVCPHCKEEYTLSRIEAAPLEGAADFGRVLAALKTEGIVEQDKQWKGMLFSRGTGCSKCEGGYTGSIGLQEVLQNSARIKEHIIQGGAAADFKKVAHIPLSIVEDGLFKAAQGLTSIEEVSKAAKA